VEIGAVKSRTGLADRKPDAGPGGNDVPAETLAKLRFGPLSDRGPVSSRTPLRRFRTPIGFNGLPWTPASLSGR
jgi:hypothetical protein